MQTNYRDQKTNASLTGWADRAKSQIAHQDATIRTLRNEAKHSGEQVASQKREIDNAKSGWLDAHKRASGSLSRLKSRLKEAEAALSDLALSAPGALLHDKHERAHGGGQRTEQAEGAGQAAAPRSDADGAPKHEFFGH